MLPSAKPMTERSPLAASIVSWEIVPPGMSGKRFVSEVQTPQRNPTGAFVRARDERLVVRSERDRERAAFAEGARRRGLVRDAGSEVYDPDPDVGSVARSIRDDECVAVGREV